MKQVIIFANQKGGVGKTTTCRELGIYFASIGKMMLLVDLDPQGNLTKSITNDGRLNGVYEAFNDMPYEFKIINDKLRVLAGDKRLSGLSKSLIGEIDSYTRLKDIFNNPIYNEFDYIFIDSPPSFNALTLNGFVASNHIIIPMSPGLYTLQGTNDLLETINKTIKSFNTGLNILGVIINGYDARPVITREIKDEIEEVFEDKVFNTVLSKTIKIEEAIAENIGVIDLKKLDKSKIKDEVESLGEELLTRLLSGGR